MEPPDHGDTWVGLSPDPLPVEAARRWAVTPGSGAVVVFCGTVRDHAGDRVGVTELEYEAYDEQVVPRLEALARSARRRWPALGRVALLHRTGVLRLTDDAVVVVATSPHRDDAFEAGRFLIDALKATVPIWKRERWEGDGEAPGGEGWGLCAHHVREVEELEDLADAVPSSGGAGPP